MNVSSVSESSARKNLFIKYANSFMSVPTDEPGRILDNTTSVEPEDINKPKGIETLTTYSIFPKQVINGKTIITA